MEGLQIAQIIADLQTLQEAPPQASLALLSASKLPPPATSPSLVRSISSNTRNPSRRPSSKPSDSSASATSTLSSPPKFDKLGRRIVQAPRPGLLPRNTSSFSASDRTGSVGSSGFATPSGGNNAGEPTDADFARAETLLSLFQMRGKFKQMGDTGLTRAKQRVDDVVARYAKMDLEEKEKAAQAKHLKVDKALIF